MSFFVFPFAGVAPLLLKFVFVVFKQRSTKGCPLFGSAGILCRWLPLCLEKASDL